MPAGCGEGSEIEFLDSSGSGHRVTVPAGLSAGDHFRVELIEEVATSPAWLSQILDALTAENFLSVLNAFCDRECDKFLLAGADASQHTLEQTDIHAKYCRIYVSQEDSSAGLRHSLLSTPMVESLLQQESRIVRP